MWNSSKPNNRGEHGTPGAFANRGKPRGEEDLEAPLSPQEPLRRSVGEIDFSIATPDYDAAIRAFLNTQTMEGPIRLRTTTEPSFFAAVATLGERADVLVAQHCATREIVGIGVRAIRQIPVKGKPTRIGYLSMLRVTQQYRTPGVLRVGYRLLNDLQKRDPVPFSLTAILKENRAARNLLEANIRGLPLYTPIMEVHTYTLDVRSRMLRREVAARPKNAGNSAVIVDHRQVRQIVIDGYSRGLQMLRPLFNAAKKLQGFSGFPPPGPLNIGYISQLKTYAPDPGDFADMLCALAAQARDKAMHFLALSLPANDSFAHIVEQHAAHMTESILYAVRWPEDPPLPDFRDNLPPVEAALTGELVARESLTPAQHGRMLEILAANFSNVTAAQFQKDLNGKNWVILIRDEAGAVVGFSTIHFYRTAFEGREIAVVFSGDTIIEREAWGSAALPRTWIQSVWQLHQAECPQLPLYWLLITSGFRTYRFLSVFWREFFPVHGMPTPAREERLLKQLARERFGAAFDAGSGVVRLGQPLVESLLPIPPAKLRDPHVAFFAQKNPGYVTGDEMVCICELTRENLTPAGWRMVEAGAHAVAEA